MPLRPPRARLAITAAAAPCTDVAGTRLPPRSSKEHDGDQEGASKEGGMLPDPSIASELLRVAVDEGEAATLQSVVRSDDSV